MTLSLSWFLLPALLASSYVHAQSGQWADPLSNIPFQWFHESTLDISYAFLFPPLQPPSNEFIGILTAPTSVGWLGVSLGGAMRSNLLVLGWVNDNKAFISPRYTSSYSSPATLLGPVVTVLGSSGVNSTHQRIVYRCQNCTSWSGGTGGIELNSVGAPFGFAAHGSIKPLSPNNAASEIYRHTLAAKFSLNTADAHSTSYSAYLTRLQNAPPLSGGAPTARTSPRSPTSTVNSCPGAPQASYAMTAASGWRAMPVLGGLTTPRGIAFDTAGHLVIVERGEGITGHVLNADGCVISSKTLIQDSELNHGIDFNLAGNQLYASSGDIAWVWDYNPSTLTATNRRALITEMYNSYHFTRTVVISKKNPNLIVVSVGSDGNIDLPSFLPATGRAAIKVFDIRTLPSGGVPFNSSQYGRIMGYGLRNDVGVTQDRAGNIHSIENSLDNAYRTINGQHKDIHINNPAEKAYNLGDPENPRNLFGGYPYCYTVWKPSDFTDKQFTVGDWFVQDPTGKYTDDWCNANAVKPTLLLPPHSAPLDIKFGLGADHNAYVALHGSWNRQPPQGYKVVLIPGNFSATGEWSPRADLASSKRAWRNLLTNRNETQCSSGCFRPAGLVFNPTGENLYVTSDTSGEVFMLKRNAGPVTNPGSSGPTVSSGTTTASPARPQQTTHVECGSGAAHTRRT